MKIRTFTLIEMLIVIVIIGILAAALIPRLQSIQGRARDTQRKADMVTLYNALMSFQLANGYAEEPEDYGEIDSPVPSVGTGDFSNSGGFMQFLVSGGILSSVPIDPINSGTGLNNTASLNYLYRCSPAGSARPGVMLRFVSESYSNTGLRTWGFFLTSTGAGDYCYNSACNTLKNTEFTCS